MVVETLHGTTVLALQAVYAAIFEESLAITADKHGFRDTSGNFRSKQYALARSVIGLAGIAISISVIPQITPYFNLFYVQAVGALIIGGILFVHVAVDSWTLSHRTPIELLLGITLLLLPQFL